MNPGIEPLLAENYGCLGEATEYVLSSTCRVQATVQDQEAEAGDTVLIAAVSLVGDVACSVFLGLPQQTACGLASRFAGFDIPFDSPDMRDAVGELANILAGDVKARLDARGVRAEISLPQVQRTAGPPIHQASVASTCYHCEAGPLWVGVAAG